jgi:hypothetical protein
VRQRLHELALRGVQVARGERDQPDAADARGAVERLVPEQRQPLGLPPPHPGRRQVTRREGHAGGGVGGEHAHLGRHVELQRLLRQTSPDDQSAAQAPEQPQRPAHAPCGVAVADRDGPRDRRDEVGVLLLRAVEPGDLVAGEELRGCPLGEGEVAPGVRGPQPAVLVDVLAAARVLRDRLEQPEPGPALRVHGDDDQGVLDEDLEQREHRSDTPSAVLTSSTASSVQPPANTDSCRSSACSGASSSS